MATIQNQAQLSYNGVLQNSNIVVGEVVQTLTMNKTSLGNQYVADSTITYILNLINSGENDITGITLTDNMGAYSFTPTSGVAQTLYPMTYIPDTAQYYSNGTLQSAPTVSYTGTTLTISGITVKGNGYATVLYQALANEYAPLVSGDTITNEVTATSTDLVDPVTASTDISAYNTAVLDIEKAMTPTTIPENGQVTYTFTITNSASVATKATDEIIITDTFLPILSGISVTYNGSSVQPTDYTYNTETGAFATSEDLISVPAATVTQDPDTGIWTITPGRAIVTVTGTV